MAELRKEDLWVMADKLRNNMDSAEYKQKDFHKKI